MTINVRVRMSFAAGHRLLGYSGKCSAPHGHNYDIELIIAGTDVDDVGMLADFSIIKRKSQEWISQHMDHAFLVNDQDAELLSALSHVAGARIYSFKSMNPTAENLARELHRSLSDHLQTRLDRVVVWESAQQWASFDPQS